jgi:hypothetical protein
MTFKVKNKWNIVPLIINVLWTFFLSYTFFVKVPLFKNEKPDGASYLIMGLSIMTF